MKIKIKSATHIGKVRDHNEDSHIVLGGDQSPPSINSALVVADGMGGHAAGEVASKLTVDHIKDQFTSGSFSAATVDELEAALRTLLQSVNQVVYTAGQDTDKRGMGTTCTLVAIKDNHLYFAHVGDSRAYLLRGKNLEQLTDGASLETQQMLEMGLIRNTKTPVKLLGRGSLTKKIKITVDKASRGAVESVTQAGGEVIIPS